MQSNIESLLLAHLPVLEQQAAAGFDVHRRQHALSTIDHFLSGVPHQLFLQLSDFLFERAHSLFVLLLQLTVLDGVLRLLKGGACPERPFVLLPILLRLLLQLHNLLVLQLQNVPRSGLLPLDSCVPVHRQFLLQ